MTAPIDRFQGPTRWLSNFEFVEITLLDGITYLTTEHAFQAQKTFDIEERRRIAALPTPRAAQVRGQQVKLRSDWEEVKIGVMLEVTRLKFKHPELRQRLIDTGDAELIEGNIWGDRTWGVVDGKGKNLLGIILMRVRDEISGLFFEHTNAAGCVLTVRSKGNCIELTVGDGWRMVVDESKDAPGRLTWIWMESTR